MSVNQQISDFFGVVQTRTLGGAGGRSAMWEVQKKMLGILLKRTGLFVLTRCPVCLLFVNWRLEGCE